MRIEAQYNVVIVACLPAYFYFICLAVLSLGCTESRPIIVPSIPPGALRLDPVHTIISLRLGGSIAS